MSGLLRRSKSTRDARAKLTRDQLDFNFAQEIQGPAAAAATAAAVTIAAPEPATTGFLKLTRRKSVSSFHTTLRVAHVADNLPKTADPRNRQSVLYRDDSVSPVPPFPIDYSDCSSSKMSSYGMEPDVGMEGEACVIGMAIGSPTEIQQQQHSSRSEKLEIPRFPMHNMYSNHGGASSASKLPDRRFEVPVKGPVASGARKTLHKEREREKEQHPHEEAPKTGWRKMFGKSFFSSKKNPPKQQQYLEPTTKLELVTRDKLSPHLVPKPKKLSKKEMPPSLAPCLDVDIPEVEMERYSVMFGTLLHPSEKSTLFARRKSRDVVSSKQRPTGTETQKQDYSQLYLTPLKRNATTGQVCRSPASMLEVSPLPSTAGTSRTPSPSSLSRAKSTSEGSPCISPRTVYMVRAHSRREALSDATEAAETPSPLLVHRRSSSKVSKISEESSIDTPRGSFDEGDDEWMTKEDDEEPQWEMVTKSQDTPMSEEQIETAAQISIARQISVSQRQLLIPIVPKSQRLVSRGPIRKAMVNPQFPIMSSQQQKLQQLYVDEEQREQLQVQ